jgi:hypothetical protein
LFVLAKLMTKASPSISLSSTFCFKSIHQRSVEYFRLQPTESIRLRAQGEGGWLLEGLRPLHIYSELLRKVPPTAVYGLKPCLIAI